MSKIKTVFFGTHDFAATILQGLLDSDAVSVEMVFTQPDRKIGRKQIIEESPVKKLALANGIAIQQPESPKDFELSTLNFQLNLGIVAQYGIIIPKKIIDSFSRGMINVHGSLLPKYRGASPIQTALINGDADTGVTIMLMDEKVDHGPILSQEKLNIAENDTYAVLSQKIAVAGVKLLLSIIPKYLSGEITTEIQSHEQATFTKLLNKDNGKIDFNKTAEEIYNLYRGLAPWPGIWMIWNEKRLKLLKIRKSEKTLPHGETLVENKKIFIGCNGGSIEVLKLQMEGKNAMDAATFLNGYKDFVNAKLK